MNTQLKAFNLEQKGKWVFITLFPEMSVEGLRCSLSEFKTVLEQEQEFVVLTDTTNGDLPSLKQRIMFIDFMNDNRSKFAKLCFGWALVVSSTPQRVLTNALGWLIPSVYPVKMFSTKEKAEEWLKKKLA